MTLASRWAFVLLSLCVGAVGAEPVMAASKATETLSLGRVVLSLTAVLGTLMCAAWYAKKIGAQRASLDAVVKIVGGVSVGRNEKVLVVEVGEQWIVVGVSRGNIQALSNMPRKVGPVPEPIEKKLTVGFSAWLKKEIDKRSSTKNEG